MPTSVKVAGAWRDVAPAGALTRVSGTWRNISTGYVKVAGNWQVFYQSDQAGPAAVVSPSAAFTVGSGTNVTASWTNPSDADISFVRVAWFINAPGSPVSTQDVSGTPSQERTASFNTASVTSNIYIQLTPYDTSGNPGPTTQIDPSSIRTSPPQNFTVSSWSYSSLTVSFSAPAFGTATSYTVEQRTQGGALISSQTNYTGYATFAASEDTKYQFYVIANNAGGSTSSAALQPWIGHSEQGYWQPVYGWDSVVSTIRPTDGGASSAAPGYPTGALYDTTPGTQWRSAGTYGSEGGVYFEAFRFYSPGGTRKLVSVQVNGDPNHQYYLGIQDFGGVWDGPVFASSIGMASSGFPFDPAIVYHDYLVQSYDSYGTAWKTMDAEAFGLVLSDYQFLQVCLTRQVLVDGNYKGVVADVFLNYREQVQVGSNWIVTRSAQTNAYW